MAFCRLTKINNNYNNDNSSKNALKHILGRIGINKILPYNLSAGPDHHPCVCNPVIIHNIDRHKTNNKKQKCCQKFSEFHPCRKFQHAYW